MKAYAVIGANYGDEGKGLMTDFLATPGSLVVRHNGGAQAGHTVVVPGTRARHVFSHIGSGTLKGIPTFLAADFIVNPLLWVKEHDELDVLGITDYVLYAHTDCVITTPVDMLINQLLERKRGGGRHGSCGVGINETVVRSAYEAYRLTISDVLDGKMTRILRRIVADWMPRRLKELGLEAPEGLKMGRMMDALRNAAEFFVDYAYIRDEGHLKLYNAIVFEGAQGLLLDEKNKENFPHVTRSRTGLTNPAELCSIAGIKELEAVYVTRSYLTRHGAGPMPGEDKNMWYEDHTNNSSEWQGVLRFAPLDVSSLVKRVNADVAQAKEANPSIDRIDVCLAVTHLDQRPAPNGLLGSDGAPWIKVYAVSGPTRQHVHRLPVMTGEERSAHLAEIKRSKAHVLSSP